MDPITKAATDLTSLQEGGPPSSGDPLVQSFATALSDLESGCSENPEKLANEIYAAQQDLQKNNRSASLLHIAQALDTAAAPLRSNGPTDCAQILAVYLVDAEKPGGIP